MSDLFGNHIVGFPTRRLILVSVGFKPQILLTTSRKHVHEMYTPLNPKFTYKTGVCRGIPIFLIIAKKIDYGYSLELPRRGDSNMHSQSMF